MQYEKEQDFYMAAETYKELAEYILEHLATEYLDSIKQFGNAAKCYSQNNDPYKSADASRRAVDVIIKNKKPSLYGLIIKHSINAKNQYGNAGYYPESGEMFRVEMHYRMLNLFNVSKTNPDSSFFYKFKSYLIGLAYFIAEQLIGFGESVLRVLCTCILTIFLYSLLYFDSHALTPSNPDYELKFYDYFYYSAVTFTTLGYGDILPQSTIYARLLSISEALIGAFIMALIVLVVTRKLARR